MKANTFVAFDLGATSGRTILGMLGEDGGFEMQEITRFANRMMALDGHLHWNIYALFDELKRGLCEIAKLGVIPTSIGIDTWGVDYACLAPDGTIIGLPYAYRDGQTIGAKERFFEKTMPASDLYRLTGIQHMDFNTVFQLHEHREDFSHKSAETHIFLPDLLSYMLTGEKVTEYTIASTGAIIDPVEKRLCRAVLDAVGCDEGKFARLVLPGHVVGKLKKHVAEEVGLPQLPVIAVAGHDTASAVAAVPTTDRNFAYLSSGTWSLMGIEIDMSVINEITERYNITNEGGVQGKVRLLKNITGMWIIEQCLARWEKDGIKYTYPQVVELAQSSEAVCIIDPDDPMFTAPDDMPAAIAQYCAVHGLAVPQTHGEYFRSIFESLATRYAQVLDLFRSLSPHPIERLHVIGGGSRNAFLNQLTADRCGIPVIAGPAEATAIGNVMIQAMAAGKVADLWEMRQLISNSIQTKTYKPTIS